MPTKRNLTQLVNNIKTFEFGNHNNSKNISYEIEGLFKPVMKNGKFSVVIRFLPSKPVEGEDVPFIENRSHMFKLNNGTWFGCDCNKKWSNLNCPICDYNSKVWTKYGKTDEARSKVLAKWRPDYYTNIYIVKAPNQPECEGKVYRLKFGRAIFKFITEAMSDKDDPELGRISGINPFSWYGPDDSEVLSGEEKSGANFIWEGVQGANGPNYDSSHFGKPSRISKLDVSGSLKPMTDSEIDVVEAKLWTLKDIEKKEENARSYEEIINLYRRKSGGEELMGEFANNTEFEATTNIKSTPTVSNNTVAVNDEEIFGTAPVKTTPKQTPVSEPEPVVEEADDDDDFFARLSG